MGAPPVTASGRVLITEHDAATRQALARHLGTLGYSADMAATAQEAEQYLRKISYDVVLVNFDSSLTGGVALVQQLNRRSASTQVVALLHQDNADPATALKFGAYDYITLPVTDFALVTEAVMRATEKADLVSQNRELLDKVRQTMLGMEQVTKKLDRLATRDDLTELQNQRYFHELLAMEVSRGQRYGRQFSLVLVDIDNFARYVATHGEKAGDLLIYSFSQLIKSTLRISDTIARYDGDEFAVILPETPFLGAQRFVARIGEAAATYAFPGSNAFPSGRLTFSAGIAAFPEHGKDSSSLLDHASNQMTSFPAV